MIINLIRQSRKSDTGWSMIIVMEKSFIEWKRDESKWPGWKLLSFTFVELTWTSLASSNCHKTRMWLRVWPRMWLIIRLVTTAPAPQSNNGSPIIPSQFQEFIPRLSLSHSEAFRFDALYFLRKRQAWVGGPFLIIIALRELHSYTF